MSDEINIFNNLDEMMKCNFLAQIRTMDAGNNSNGITNDNQNNDDDFDEYDSFLNNNAIKSPTKRTRKNEIEQKKTKENAKTQRSSSSRESSFSPPMQLLQNLNDNLVDIPVSARTRRSLGRAKKSLDHAGNDNVGSSSTKSTRQVPTSSKRGRGRGGRGNDRGRGANTNSSSITNNGILDDSLNTDDSFNHSSDLEYTPETQNTASASRNSNTSTSIMERFLIRGRNGRVGRARVTRSRRYLAEFGARCQTIDSIDLISSHFPRVEGSITLDSDGEEELPRSRHQQRKTTTATNTPLDISLEDDNPELSVKINWKGVPEAFKLRKYQKFTTIFKLLAERENTKLENIVFNLNERIISPDDTPDSIGYKIFHFINGRVLTSNVNSLSGPAGVPKKQRNINQINLKIQSDKWKRPLQINMLKSDKFRVLYIKCSEELSVGIEQIKLSFDGENVEINDTPADLDLEGGEAIDLRLKN